MDTPTLSDTFPTIYFYAPSNGWIFFDVEYQDQGFQSVVSSVGLDAFGDMLLWLEAVLLEELPATWLSWGEEIRVSFIVEPAAAGQVTFTVIPHQFGDSAGFAPEPIVFASVTVDPATLVRSYADAFHNLIAERYDGEWAFEIADLDFSRVNALLVGEGDAGAWREELRSGAREYTLYAATPP